MKITSAVCAIGVVLCALLATGCSGGQSDLQKWIEVTKKKPGGRILPLPEVKPYETYVYAARTCARRSNRKVPVRPTARQVCGRARAAIVSSWKAFRSTL